MRCLSKWGCGLKTEDCGWSLQKLHMADRHTVDAVCLSVLDSWEAEGELGAHHAWGSFALQAWSKDPLFRQAEVSQIVFCVAKVMWKPALAGRAFGLHLADNARMLQRSRPFESLLGSLAHR